MKKSLVYLRVLSGVETRTYEWDNPPPENEKLPPGQRLDTEDYLFRILPRITYIPFHVSHYPVKVKSWHQLLPVPSHIRWWDSGPFP